VACRVSGAGADRTGAVGGALLCLPVEWVHPENFGVDALTGICVSMGINTPPLVREFSGETRLEPVMDLKTLKNQ